MSMNEELPHVGETCSVIVEGLVDRATGARVVGATMGATVTNPTGGSVAVSAQTYHAVQHAYEVRFVPLVAGQHRVAVDVVAVDGAKFRARGGKVVYAWP